MRVELPRLDVLLYAHDGRGLGHAGRSIAIGMAIRRCYPGLRVLFVSGCTLAGELIGNTSLDWLKLPAYKTEVVAGRSRGVDGNSGFSDHDLGLFRGLQLRDLIRLYRPRMVVCDHSPQGKHKEMIPALEATSAEDTRWVLGVRGVVGGVPQASSGLARELFAKHYHGLLWYGDSEVLGTDNLEELGSFYGMQPLECGYVSRLGEVCLRTGAGRQDRKRYCCTVSIPWLGEQSFPFVSELAKALADIGPDYGLWRLFIDFGEASAGDRVQNLFLPLSHCRVEPPSGHAYVEALLNSETALIYGGYNSLADVLRCAIPALVVLREMKDNEQQIHVQRLLTHSGQLRTISESDARSEQIRSLFFEILHSSFVEESKVNMNGAKNSADYIAALLGSTK
ncbi:hypothetical protein [Desulfopila sp. IMCC35008]|uniref:hypothetical protein n=1 Tax=Desulfopila sp. IMCC35008 TaxID=2653858 RepID=UPI0013D2A22D|nr:hypothetical protein [Desulfopila sp. IMCC35008]